MNISNAGSKFLKSCNEDSFITIYSYRKGILHHITLMFLVYVEQRFSTLQQCSRFGELRKKTSVHEWHLIVSSILWNVTNLVVKMLIFFFILILLSKKFRFIGTLTKRKELFDNICRASAYIRMWFTCTLQTRTLTKRYLWQICLYLQPCRWTSICVVIISSANVNHAINI